MRSSEEWMTWLAVQECRPGSLVHQVITAALPDPVPAPRRKASRRLRFSGFWTTVCKTVRPMLPNRRPVLSCPVCLSVCNVGVLWPNGWMDQDQTWRGGRPRPRPHCVRWGPSSPKKGHSPTNFRPMSVVTK